MTACNTPVADSCVVRNLIERHARDIPDKTFAVFEDGSSWSYSQLQQRITRYAKGLQELGINQGEFVLSWLPNGPQAVQTFLAVNYLGAVYVPVNTSYIGTVLQHVIAISGARVMLTTASLAGRLENIDTGNLQTVVVTGDTHPQSSRLEVIPDSVLFSTDGKPRPPQVDIQPWHTHAVIFTSGTTGPSKGVLSSYIQSHQFITALRHLGPDDCNLANLPMYHATGMYAVYSMLMHGGTVCVVDGFHTSGFWETVNRNGVTTAGLLGVMMQFLIKEPPGEDDKSNTLRTALVVPLDEDAMRFAARFGVDIYTVYNMCELSGPLYDGPNPDTPGSCGKVRPGVQVRLVDKNDLEVGPGEQGELIVRTDMPWALNHGYLNDPGATAEAWRNGWFHTGDLLRMDQHGNFFFVDRIKDAIRRRGENISSFEVENEIAVHPDVREVAVIGVAFGPDDEEIMAVVAPVAGREIEPADLVEFLRSRLAYFMIPRFIRFISELPKTPTQKVMKPLLRDEGVTADTWDREAAGIIIKREQPG